MHQVTEILDAYPVSDELLTLQRDEDHLFTKPRLGPIKLLEHENIAKVHFPVVYEPSKFARPMGVYASNFLRIEWQKMNFRQPFYHRNADVDEMSYQVYGSQTLMTELGSVDLAPGDFTRIPVGIAHNNDGREEVHLLFYVPASVLECGLPDRTAKYSIPPFRGWVANNVAEVLTNCLGGPECDISASMNAEELLLKHEENLKDSDMIQVLRARDDSEGTTWMYKARHVWIGLTKSRGTTTSNKAATRSSRVYHRHRACEEIQCQIRGSRTLVSQRGNIDLLPGDFTSIPVGVAFTQVVTSGGESEHVTVLTHLSAPRVAPVGVEATETTLEFVKQLCE